ncbi:hypothetical protein ACSQ67_002255 [Phaseolus vulgaris]
MMHRRRNSRQSKHPFHAYPFETLLSGSWQAVEFIKIEAGTTSLQCIDNHHRTTEKGLLSDLRIRSRKATLSDCSNFLRRGIDICVLSASQSGDTNSDGFCADNVWLDAKINSIQRKHHNSGCSCLYYVNLYVNQGSLGREIRTLSKEVKVIGINEIAILQKLERNTCEDQHYRWESSEDCSQVLHTKLILGKFLSDLSWLVVTSALKKVSFYARSVENKIVYQILGSDATSSSLNMHSSMRVVNFEVNDGTMKPIVTQVDVCDTNTHDSHYDEVSPSYDVEGLRRSKRMNIQPERYLGCGNVSEIKVGNVRTWPYKIKKRKDDDDVCSCRQILVYKRDSLALEHHDLNDKGTSSNANYSNHKHKRKRFLDSDPGWEDLNSNLKSNRNYRSLNATDYKEIIDSYLKDINRTPTKEEPTVMDLWKEITKLEKKKEAEIPQREEEEQISEMDMLWREMEMALTSSHIEEGSIGANFAENSEESNHTCQHDYRLYEEIGIYCFKCGFVKTEIKYVTPPFMKKYYQVRQQEEKQCSGKEADKDDDFHQLSSRDELISMEHDNVWKLIPELREKMHVHQKKAFEFLWQNISGSMDPTLMDAESKRRGGCVISHSPGSGKTFLIIAFLISYLKLFPGMKPLVLAPTTTLHTWHKEFIKWDISVPVYLIHGRSEPQKDDMQNSTVLPHFRNPNKNVKHILNCLDKIRKWQTHPGVLVMSYTSFLALMREGSEFTPRKYMAKALRERSGILILDEGHNPRSTKSRLRKVLMKVQTDIRILLSGTLFQNNFSEYFNTLCLARPKFIYEVLKELDTNDRRKGKTTEKSRHLLESQARKLFLDNITKKIDSSNRHERMQGLNMLREITNGFIDIYESASFNSVPGLKMFTLLMNTTDLQSEVLMKLHKRMAECTGYPLELELLITLGSIHPWLVKTASYANKFMALDQLQQLEKCKLDLKAGSKVKFVMSLVLHVMEKEKVLIFCHNHAPVKLLVELFEMVFKWEKGREILLLNGEQDLFERGKVIDKFEEPRGASKVLLASIKACGEGISLTSASRVIFLDSEWNPSKTKQAIARAFRPGQQKMVYAYQLLARGTLEEDKYRRTTWKEWVSSMIFSEAFQENTSHSQAKMIEDDILREMVEEDKSKSIHMILKNEKASTN